ncbi:hypothetical protein NLU13_9767 [Sarocladium strictum]|uniref:Leucine-rich repeat-containing protein 40 n=1 Tax=Sarocladium strictum TaxID=5046 RepID=A0AA39GB29_SARSR|nr:hypothetical protein NLU13_9767 [Sarocladium strictum]
MDDIHGKAAAANRLSKLPRPASGIPKPSALPRPSSRASGLQPPKPTRASSSAADILPADGDSRTSRLRASMSRDSLRSSITATTPGRSIPRLRASASRDSLIATSTARPPMRPKAQPPVTGQQQSRILPTPQRKPRSSIVAEPGAESTPVLEADEDQTSEIEAAVDTDRPLFRRRLTLTRKPSESFNFSPTQELFDSIHRDDTPTNDSTEGDMPPPPARSVRPRPSLTERTMQSLAQIPSSPALKKKNSSFFEQPRSRSRAGSTSSRPGSSYNSDGSGRHMSRPVSRPGSASGQDDNGSRPGTATYKSSLSTIDGTPEGLTTGGSSLRLSKLQATPSRGSLSSKLPSGRPSLSGETFATPQKKNYGALPSHSGSQSVAARPSKARGSTNGLFKKPSMPSMASDLGGSGEAPTVLDEPSESSWGNTFPSISPARPSQASETPPLSARKSSAALRDQIAKAKAAKRAAMKQAAETQVQSDDQRPIVPVDDGFDFGVAHEDPFNLRKGENPGKKVLLQRIIAARTSGRLNIAALNLKEIPIEVMKMYDLENIGANDGSWAESVDITRFVAADNEFETLDELIFPDQSHSDPDNDDEGSGNIFAGLENLDLHNNLLVNVPLGFRRLNYLTSLNLSSNRLTNNSLDTISQMSSLRDLKLANNLLFGPMPASFANLGELEILDLHGNNVSALPADVENMTQLRILNLNENSFESLPFDALAKLPLTELLVRKNKLRGTLIEDPIESLPHLQTLDVSSNQLLRIVELGSSISLPVMHALSLSMNRLQGLPDMTTWTSLLTLTVDENNISSIPNSFTSLEKLRHADFSSNDIRVVPPEIARMDNLSMIRLSGNPLRDKKFVSIPTDDLKEMLAARLEPPPPYQEPRSQQVAGNVAVDPKVIQSGDLPTGDAKSPVGPHDDDSLDDDFATPPTSAPNSPSRSRAHTNASLRSRTRTLSNQMWPVKNGGLLDRSQTESSSLHPVVASQIAAEHQIKQIHLHHNLFTTFPNSLSFFADTLTSLSLANNQLTAEGYLNEELELKALRELNLGTNRITSLKPLTNFLCAPALEKLDVSFNRLNALPTDLREAFPSLTVLLVPNNHLIELTPESITGLRIVDATNNDISHLNPKIGLLGGEGGLERLDVMGNRFRVPRFNVLERGTEATLRWLRGRVPVAEMAAWKGDDGDESPEGGWP